MGVEGDVSMYVCVCMYLFELFLFASRIDPPAGPVWLAGGASAIRAEIEPPVQGRLPGWRVACGPRSPRCFFLSTFMRFFVTPAINKHYFVFKGGKNVAKMLDASKIHHPKSVC